MTEKEGKQWSEVKGEILGIKDYSRERDQKVWLEPEWRGMLGFGEIN